MALANITNNILTDSGILVTNLTPTSRTITINGVTYDLSADRSWSVGTTTGSGAAGQVTYFSGASSITGSNNLFWDTANNRLGVNTNTPTATFDVHGTTNVIAQLNQLTTGQNALLTFMDNSVGKWRLGNIYNAAANDFGIVDITNTLQRLTIKNTGQTFIGTETASSGLFVVNSSTGDNHIVAIGATAPSIRVRNAGTAPTQQFGLGLATTTNNFIQGSASGDFCIFNASTTASPILFGIYNGVNIQEAGRISAARNFLFGQIADTGEKLQVTGNVKIIGNLTANNIGGAVMPTFSFITNNQLNPSFSFDSFLMTPNINGTILSGYTKTGNLSITNTQNVTSFISDVEVLVVCQFNFQNITTLSLPNLVSISQSFNASAFLITDLSSSIPNLQRVGGSFSLSSYLNITNLNFNSLIYCGSLTLSNNNQTIVTSMSLPNLVSIGGNMTIGPQSALTTFNFNSLESVFATISLSGLTNLTSVNFPALRIVNNNNTATALNIQSSTNLTSVTLPSIERIYSSGGSTIIFSSGTANLQTFSFGSGLKQIGVTSGNVLFTSCALNQSSVDGILVRLAALDGTNGTTTFNNRTVTITGTSATPSATGLAAKATLQARGCIVTNN